MLRAATQLRPPQHLLSPSSLPIPTYRIGSATKFGKGYNTAALLASRKLCAGTHPYLSPGGRVHTPRLQGQRQDYSHPTRAHGSPSQVFTLLHIGIWILGSRPSGTATVSLDYVCGLVDDDWSVDVFRFLDKRTQATPRATNNCSSPRKKNEEPVLNRHLKRALRVEGHARMPQRQDAIVATCQAWKKIYTIYFGGSWKIWKHQTGMYKSLLFLALRAIVII